MRRLARWACDRTDLAHTMSVITSDPILNPAPPPSGAGLTFAAKERAWFSADPVLRALTGFAAVCILGMIGVLVGVLFWTSIPSIRAFGFSFLVSTEWRPNEREVPKRGPDGKILIEDGETVMETLPPMFGAAAVIYGTAASSLIALLFAVPLSFGASLFLVRIAPKAMVAPVSFLIELLAAIPSIAYGMWGLFVLAPWLQNHLEPFLFRVLGGVPGFGWLFFNDGRQLALSGKDMLTGGPFPWVINPPAIPPIRPGGVCPLA